MDLSDWIDRHAAFAPGKVALRLRRPRLHAMPISRARSRRRPAALAACGVAPRRPRRAISATTAPSSCACCSPARALGALFVPLSWRLAPPEHRAMLADCRPRVLVVADPFVGPTAGIVDPATDRVRVAIGAARDGWIAVRPVPRARRDAAAARGRRRATRRRCCFATRRVRPGQPKGRRARRRTRCSTTRSTARTCTTSSAATWC